MDNENDCMIGINDEISLLKTEKQCAESFDCKESDYHKNVSEFNLRAAAYEHNHECCRYCLVIFSLFSCMFTLP